MICGASCSSGGRRPMMLDECVCCEENECDAVLRCGHAVCCEPCLPLFLRHLPGRPPPTCMICGAPADVFSDLLHAGTNGVGGSSDGVPSTPPAVGTCPSVLSPLSVASKKSWADEVEDEADGSPRLPSLLPPLASRSVSLPAPGEVRKGK